jgi:hypothetical protein
MVLSLTLLAGEKISVVGLLPKILKKLKGERLAIILLHQWYWQSKLAVGQLLQAGNHATRWFLSGRGLFSFFVILTAEMQRAAE